jgi:predicted Ser/Thr protein kinase
MAGPSPRNVVGPPCPTCGYLADPGAGPVNFCPKCGHDLRNPGAQTSTASLLGMVVADRYKLVLPLGEGGMGAVYKAEHVRMGKALAVKVLRGAFARDPSAVERFRSEARIVSKLSHPNTIAVFDFGEMEGGRGFYLAMEYVPGRDLSRVIKEEGRLAETRVADLAQQILGSLAEAHGAGIIHRDMKPGNVMLMQTRPGEDFVKVLDFGIAKLRDDGDGSQTTTGAVVGTPNYLAPEQARGEQVDARADLYAVGCLLYELLAGHAPFAGRAPSAVVNAHLHEPVPSLALAAPGTSRRLVEIVHKALSKRRQDRFASADEMREAILALGEPTSSRTIARPQITGELEIASREDFREFDRTLRAFRRRRTAAPIYLLALLVAAGGLAWRWSEVYAALAAHAPALAARIPAALRPSDRFDGEEHERNDTPAQATRLPLPVDAAGLPTAEAVTVKGTVGARIDAQNGDADIYRLDVPTLPGPRVLSVRWHAERSEDGIRGLAVALALNRAPAPGSERGSAPLVASSARGGPGSAEVLEAPVVPGTYYLSVRERHDDVTGPVEKPTDRYVLEVRLREPRPGEEVEPNDAPESSGQRGGGYADWRAMAERNPLPEARTVRGEIAAGDADTFALEVEGHTAVVLVLPSPGLAPALELWAPEAADLEPGAGARARLDPAGRADAGEPLLVVAPTSAIGPTLVRLSAADGRGPYSVVALGAGRGSGAAAVERVRALVTAGKLPTALELAALVGKALTRAPARAELLALAAKLAAEAAPGLTPDDLPRFEAADRALGTPIFEQEGGSIRYRGAFEKHR